MKEHNLPSGANRKKEDWAEVKEMDTGKLVAVVTKVQELALATLFEQDLRVDKCLLYQKTSLNEGLIVHVFKPR